MSDEREWFDFNTYTARAGYKFWVFFKAKQRIEVVMRNEDGFSVVTTGRPRKMIGTPTHIMPYKPGELKPRQPEA